MEEQKLLKKKRTAEKEHNWKNIADFSNKLGALYSENGDYGSAIEQFTDEFHAYKRLGLKMEAGHAERMIGEMLMYQGEYDSALIRAKNYLKTAVEERNKIEEQRAYATIARIHLVHGQSEEDPVNRRRIINLAQKAFLEAALLCKTIEKQVGRYQAADMEARVYLNLGVCKEYCEEFNAAIDYMQTAIQIAKKFDLHELLYQCYTSAGLMHSLRTGDTGKSLLMFNLALQTAERLVDKTKKVCEVLQMKAEVSIKIGDIKSAKEPLVDAYKLKCSDKILRNSIEKTLRVLIAVERAQETLLNSDSQECETQKRLYETLGDGWCQLGNYSKAIEYYLKMLGCAELEGASQSELVPIYVSLYQTYRDNKQYEEALKYMKKEHDLIENNTKEAFETLMCIADVQELAGKSFFEIEDSYKTAQTLAKLINDENATKRTLFKLLQLTRKHGMMVNEEEVVREITEIGLTPEELVRAFDISPDSQEISEEDVPDIGHDINLHELFHVEDTSRVTSMRKRTGIKIQTKRNQKGETPLHIACIAGNLNLVKQLLDQGHDTIVRDNAGWIPLHEACNHGFKEIVVELLDRSGNRGINDRGGTKCDGVTPLYDACCNGNLEIIELLLERGADPTMKTNDGDSALNALQLWRESAGRLTDAEECLYEALCQKMRHSLEKTGNLDKSRESEGKRRSAGKSTVEVDVRSNCSSENKRTQRIENLRLGIQDYSSDSDSDPEITTSHPRSLSLVPTPSKISKQKRARSDYKEVMAKLRNPHTFPSSTFHHHETHEKKESALISTTNIDDDWLEDDLGPKSKRQKFLSEPLTKVRTSYQSPAKKSQEIDSTITDLSNWEPDVFALDDVPLWQSTGVVKSNSPKKTLKRQTSLLSAGFSRSQSPKSDVPDSTNEHLLPSMSFTATCASDRPMGLKMIAVKISDELISVPVKMSEVEKLDVGWLVNEVKRRYSNLFGRSPEIRLTLDNALVETTDPLEIVFSANEIGARIIKMNTTSLMDRYRTACQEHSKDIIEEVLNALELSLPSKILNLSDQLLSACEFLPVSVAIKLETDLVSINLDNNWLQNDGVRHLSDAIIELKNIHELQLAGNCVEYEGIKILCEKNVFLSLRSLVLDYNPIGDTGLKILCENGTNLCPNLTKLLVSGCEIRKIYENSSFLRKLSHLDISENHLSKESFEILAKIIDRDKINVLNLNNINHDSLNWVKFFQDPFPVLEELNVASNHLTDTDVSELLNACICLRSLDLSHNLSLTPSTFEYFMKKENGDNKYSSSIQKIYFNGCQKLLPTTKMMTSINNTHIHTLVEYMELTLDITNPIERETQEKFVREIWDACYNNHDDDDNSNTNVNIRNKLRRSMRRGCVKVNKFHLTAFILDTTD